MHQLHLCPFFVFADSELMSGPAAATATATNCRYH